MVYDKESKGKSFFKLYKYYQTLKNSFSLGKRKDMPSQRSIRRPSIKGFFQYRPTVEKNIILQKRVEELEQKLEQEQLKRQELELKIKQEQIKSLDLEQKNIQLEITSSTDVLTHLQNRDGFNNSLTSKIARSMLFDKSISLILFDLDNFKECNDALGHPEGDKCLQKFGSILKQQIRKDDSASRLGGDEFAVILYNASIVNAKEVTERIRNNLLEQDISFDSKDSKTGIEEKKQVSSSAGVFHVNKEQWTKIAGYLNIDRKKLKEAYSNLDRQVTSIEDINTIDTFRNTIKEVVMPVIYREADNTLYAAKRRGKNCVQVSTADFKPKHFEQEIQNQNNNSTHNRSLNQSHSDKER
ncbi:MAG: GGDEF domain-containing protein [Ignavibacteriales bacterium]